MFTVSLCTFASHPSAFFGRKSSSKLKVLLIKSCDGLFLSEILPEMVGYPDMKSVNLQFNTVGRRDDDMIVPPSDGPMIIWIDWE